MWCHPVDTVAVTAQIWPRDTTWKLHQSCDIRIIWKDIKQSTHSALKAEWVVKVTGLCTHKGERTVYCRLELNKRLQYQQMVLWYLVVCSEVFPYWDWGSEALWEFAIQEHDHQHASTTRCVCGPTSVGVLSLQTLSVQYMDLSDQLRVATHPRPTCLRRLVQSQLSGKERAHVIVIKLLKPTALRIKICFQTSALY